VGFEGKKAAQGGTKRANNYGRKKKGKKGKEWVGSEEKKKNEGGQERTFRGKGGGEKGGKTGGEKGAKRNVMISKGLGGGLIRQGGGYARLRSGQSTLKMICDSAGKGGAGGGEKGPEI